MIVSTENGSPKPEDVYGAIKELSARQARWAEELSPYDFVIEHVKRKENIVADALSRRPDHKPEEIPSRTTQILRW